MKKIFLIVMTIATLVACGGKGDVKSGDDTVAVADSAANGEAVTDTAAVDVDAVSSATNVANSPTFNGLIMVAPDQQATVSVTMGGRIHSLNVMPGKAVGRGQVIATLDNPEFIELQQAYLESAAQLEYLEKEYARQRSLSGDAASKKRVEESKAEFLSMKSRRDAAATKLQALGVSTKAIVDHGIKAFLPITAPITGFVTSLDANLGKYVEAGSAICDIINKSHPIIQLTVYEKDIHLMKTGDALLFRVNGMGKKSFAATVASVDQAVDEKDYSIKVYARVKDADASFRPGMYVRAKKVQTEK